MKKRKILLALLCLCFLLPLCLSGCGYDEEWIIGKTSAEIQERYGTFYQVIVLPYGDPIEVNEDTICKNAKGYYLIEEERVGWLGTYPEEYFVIRFDENGIAIDCYEELGGKGG
ncbi:MAG: hypothetical protein IKK06_06915 [Clostridia bacterium]|nr:hypothetical protein [Clostridia bacterium]